VWFEIMTQFQDETQSGKICAFTKIRISPNLIIKKKWHIGATINTRYIYIFQNISFENSSWRKRVFWEKGPQKGQQS